MVTDKKFTKGKWIIKASICFESEIRTEDGVRIAKTKSYGEGFNDATEEEQKANAKLIAAAPDLLEACERALETIENENIFGQARLLLAVAIKKATE